MRVFENRALRRIFGPKTDEVSGQWRRLYTEEFLRSVLLTKYCSGDKIKKNEMDGRVARMVERGGAYRIWVRKSKGKRPLGRPFCRWGDNNKFYL